MPFGHAAPHNVLAYYTEELPAEATRLVSAVTGSMLLRLITELYDHGAADGRTGVDTGWLRGELNTPADPWE